ncbi:unannotated protein [freshwater metagenome]|uniref:Unannotated protein n=1 Tax=freshwater metagenome TaxID=449393 RepID=A0A6J7GLG7_9ZZZZ
MSGVRLSRAVSSRLARPAAKVSSASPPVNMMTMMSAAQYSPTTTVATMAVMARTSMPHLPRTMDRTMATPSSSATRMAKALIPH